MNWKKIPPKPHTTHGIYEIHRDIWSDKNHIVAECMDEDDANLIAAAPDLLAALKELRQAACSLCPNRSADCICGYSIQADEAIEKAEGES